MLIAAGLAAYQAFDLGRFLTPEALQRHQAWLVGQVERHRVLSVLAYVGIYALAAALALPGVWVLTLAGGMLFGAVAATLYVAVGATAGATVLFLAVRHGFGHRWRSRLGKTVDRLRDGFRRHALSYMLFLRLVPLFPFWLVSLAPGMLGVPLHTFVIGTAFGGLPWSYAVASLGRSVGAMLHQGHVPGFLDLLSRPDVAVPLAVLSVLALAPVAWRKWQGRRREA